MSSPSRIELPKNTTALFGRASRNSELSILPINDSALNNEERSPAFYCVHSLSGAAGLDYLDLARQLDPTVRFYGIQAPPKKMQDVEFGGSVESVANYYADALIEFQRKGPFLLGGWSAGAIIALVIAQNLRAHGREVGLLVAIDWAPENTGAGLRPWNPLYLMELAANLPGGIIHRGLKNSFHSLRRASNKVIALGTAMASKRGEKRGGGSALKGWDLSRYPLAQRLFMHRLYGALLGYLPKKYLGDVVVYEASVTPLSHLPQLGRKWRAIAPQSDIVRIAGTHVSMLREPYVVVLAKHLRNRIAEVVVNQTDAARPETIGPVRPRVRQRRK